MDHNQTITDLFLAKHLSTEHSIVAPQLYEAIKGDMNPKMELPEFRVILREWFAGPLNQYESVKRVGIRKVDEALRAAKKESSSGSTNGSTLIGLENLDENSSPEETEDEHEGLVVYLSPSVRISQPDSRQWALQKRNGDNWISKYYQQSLDAIINSYIRHALNDEFKASPSKIAELKDLVKVIKDVRSSLEATFKAIVVEKTPDDKDGEKAA